MQSKFEDLAVTFSGSATVDKVKKFLEEERSVIFIVLILCRLCLRSFEML